MTLLDNELVRKYFEHDNGGYERRILHAMQEPIKKGERYICNPWGYEPDQWGERTCDGTVDYSDWHPSCLRIPDRFQKQECIVCDKTIGPLPSLCEEHQKWWNAKPTPEPERCNCTRLPCWHGTMPKDEVEESIHNILKAPIFDKQLGWFQGIEEKLRELVVLARKK